MSDNKILGAKGSNNKPQESTNTLRSKSVARVLDLLSEGPIKGLVNDKQGILINEVAWERSNGVENFEGLTADIRYGDNVQDPINGFPATEREISDMRAITFGNIAGQPQLQPEIQINDYLIDAVRVAIQVPALAETQKDGDIVGSSAQIKIEVKNALTSYSTVIIDTIAGKTTSPYERSYRIRLPKDPTDPSGNYGFPCKIRCSRLTPDSDQIKLQNSTELSHYTEIIDHKLSYPDTAYIGMTFDCKLFEEGVPQRLYHIDGLKMSVPSNYYPLGMTLENWMPMTEDFTNAIWSNVNINAPVVGNNIVSPDGTANAQVLVPNTTSGFHFINTSGNSGITGLATATHYTASVYVKQANAACTGVQFIVYALDAGTVYGTYYLDFSFATGTAVYSSVSLAANGGVNTGYGAEAVGNGWYRLWISGYPSSSRSKILPRIFIGTSAGYTFAGNGSTGYLAVWGWQINKGKTPTQYLKNTTLTKTTGLSGKAYYDGTWDGTFKTEWTNNPAWILYMLLTHSRIGLGQWINESLVDKWSLYSLAQYCDEEVPDGFGGFEPRFTFNGVIRNREEAYNVIQNIATVFRGIVYWGAGSTLVSWDAPKDASILVTPANVIDGIFDYKGVGWKARHSAVLVKWNDPDNLYKDAVEVVEDQDLILKYGWKPLETTAIGCTSRGQAYRWGKWILYTEKYETETVVYKASFDHMIKDGTAVMPGDIIKIMDPSYAGVRNGGRVTDITGNLLLYSNQLNQATWAKGGATVTANAISRQTVTFDQIFETAATATTHGISQTISSSLLMSGETHNISFYVTMPAANASPIVALQVNYGTTITTRSTVLFDLSALTVTYGQNDYGAKNAKIDYMGGPTGEEVYRISFDFSIVEPAPNANFQARLYLTDATGNLTYNGNTARSIYAAQAQLSPCAGVQDYMDSTTTVRQGVIVDTEVTLLAGIAYTVSVVLPTGKVEDRTVTTSPGVRTLLAVDKNFSVPPLVNAMWIISSAELEPRTFRVLSIREEEKNIVEVTALYHNPNKFAMVEQDLKFETPNFSVISLAPLDPPYNFNYDEYLYRSVAHTIQSAVALSWTPPKNEGRVTLYDIQVKNPNEDWKYLGSTSDSNFTIENAKPGLHSYRVRASGAFGSPSTWQTIENVELFGLSQKPPPVTNFNMNAIGDQAYLTWDPITDPTVGRFIVKIENVVSGAQWGSGIVVLDNIPANSSHVYVPLRFGSYMIKSVSLADVEAATATYVTSDVAGINNFNATETIITEPTFPGTKTSCTVVSNTLVTSSTGGLYPAEAIYELSTVVNLGEVFTNRLTPTITAAGQRATYTMATWGFLNQVERLDGGVENSWSVVVEYKTTRDDPALGTAVWTDWRPLIVGDSTARGYKFRVRLLSYDTSVQVRVGAFRVIVDMPDRVEGKQGVAVPGAPTTTGLNIAYDNPFKAVPAVAVTIQNADPNDAAVLANETRSGFNIKIYNGGVLVARTINWVAKGYGKQ